jgi:hypothetical protein
VSSFLSIRYRQVSNWLETGALTAALTRPARTARRRRRLRARPHRYVRRPGGTRGRGRLPAAAAGTALYALRTATAGLTALTRSAARIVLTGLFLDEAARHRTLHIISARSLTFMTHGGSWRLAPTVTRPDGLFAELHRLQDGADAHERIASAHGGCGAANPGDARSSAAVRPRSSGLLRFADGLTERERGRPVDQRVSSQAARSAHVSELIPGDEADPQLRQYRGRQASPHPTDGDATVLLFCCFRTRRFTWCYRAGFVIRAG